MGNRDCLWLSFVVGKLLNPASQQSVLLGGTGPEGDIIGHY